MSDERSNQETLPWQRIDLEDRDEVRDWAASFSVTEEQLIEAVRVAGVQASNVRSFLDKTRVS